MLVSKLMKPGTPSVQPQNSTEYVVILGKGDDDEVIFTCTADSFNDASSKAKAVYPHLETLHIEQTGSVEEAWEEFLRRLE